MANKDAPLGLVPIRHSNGAPYNGAYSEYYVPAAYDQILGVGDPVLISGTANTTEYKGNPPGTLPEVIIAVAGAGTNYITGAIVGFNILPTDLSKTYNAAKTERIVYVADDPDLVFEIQEDSDGAALAVTDVGINADIVFTHSTSTVTGKSGVELDSSSHATGGTEQLKIRRLVNRVDNEIGDNAKWEVTINLHTQRVVAGV